MFTRNFLRSLLRRVELDFVLIYIVSTISSLYPLILLLEVSLTRGLGYLFSNQGDWSLWLLTCSRSLASSFLISLDQPRGLLIYLNRFLGLLISLDWSFNFVDPFGAVCSMSWVLYVLNILNLSSKCLDFLSLQVFWFLKSLIFRVFDL